MKNKKPMPKSVKIVTAVIAAVIVLLLTAFWVMSAYIELNKSNSYDYSNYTSTRLIAHRGYSAAYFDNTEQAFKAAADENGFYGIETDIRLTTDGVWVCSHDDNPFVDKSILISQSAYSDISSLPLDISGKDETADGTCEYYLCTYETYLKTCKQGNKYALIEIKGKYTKEQLTPAVSKAVVTLTAYRIIFASFYTENLAAVREINYLPRLLAFSGNSFLVYCYTGMGYNVGTDVKHATLKRINRSHDKEHNFFVYNVETAEELAQLTEYKVDYAISDRLLV